MRSLTLEIDMVKEGIPTWNKALRWNIDIEMQRGGRESEETCRQCWGIIASNH